MKEEKGFIKPTMSLFVATVLLSFCFSYKLIVRIGHRWNCRLCYCRYCYCHYIFATAIVVTTIVVCASVVTEIVII